MAQHDDPFSDPYAQSPAGSALEIADPYSAIPVGSAQPLRNVQVNSLAPSVSVPDDTRRSPYTLTVQDSLFDKVPPSFWLSGTGDLRALAQRTGLVWDTSERRYRAPTPYHARLIWCYADSAADAALRKLFPKFGRPTKPIHVPFVLAANDRIICLTAADGSERPRAAGFIRNEFGQFWETRDLRRVLPLLDIAEDDLRRRLDAVTSLPFDALSDVSIADLVRLPPPQKGDGDGGAAASEGDSGDKPVLEFDAATGLYTCAHPAAKGAGFRASGTDRFVSSDFEQAQRLRAFADDAAEIRLQVDAMVRTIPHPYTADPRPVPQSPTAPFPFGPDQLEAIQFACTRFGSIIADEMGVGKTAESIGVLNVERPRLALVLVPANLQDNWMKECKSYLSAPNVAAIFGRGKHRDVLPANANVIIASYDLLPRLPLLHDLSPDILICDEAQEIKSEATKAGRIIYEKIAPKAGKFIWMTGTPIWNRPQDLWAPLHTIAPEVFPHKANFMRMYRVNDPENLTSEQELRLDFLAHLLKSGIMIRRLKDEVLKLPPKVHHIVDVSLPPDVLAQLRERDRKVVEVEEAAKQASGTEARTKHKTLFSEIARLRREVGEAKFEFVRDEVVRFIQAHARAERPRPPLVFGRHRELLRRFADTLNQMTGVATETLTGEATSKARQKRVDNFQEGRSGAAVAGFDAAGVGYTMTRSCDVFMFEVDYTPALMKQAIDRIHRRGQDRECNVYWFVVDGTIDARIAKLFVAKDQVAQFALGDHLVGMFDPHELYQHALLLQQQDQAPQQRAAAA